MSVVTESGDTKEAILKARASFFELESGVQRFEAEDISRELTVLGILGTCKSYEFNITAEVEGKKTADGISFRGEPIHQSTICCLLGDHSLEERLINQITTPPPKKNKVGLKGLAI